MNFENIEQIVNYQLNKNPSLKKIIKSAYQHFMYAVSPKIKSEGNIIRVSPDDPDHEYFFGYYGICPWDATDRYVLCLKANDTWSNVAPSEPAEILLIDTELPDKDPNRYRTIAVTHTWNVQQGCMMQWLGPDFDHEIIYNDFREERYVSVVLNVFTGEERVLKAPVYSVSGDGSFALTLDFSRLHRLRPGYGYSNLPDETEGDKLPDSTCIWKLDIRKNELYSLLKYTDLASFEPKSSMTYAEHKVNHIMLNPDGSRFMVLHRWINKGRKYTRLVTIDADGSGMYNLSDDDMVSHCYWKNNRIILAFENKKNEGQGYYIMKDRSTEYKHLWKDINNDGHPSFSPDGKKVVIDSYPNRSRVQTIKLMGKTNGRVIAKVFAPFKYDNDTRCDLHPRWNRKGDMIAFDAVYEGNRKMYYVFCLEGKK